MRSKNDTTASKANRSLSSKAGIVFPVGRIKRNLRQILLGKRISYLTSIYLAAVLEYLVAEIIELSGEVAKQNNKKRITPRHLCLAVKNDSEINILLRQVTIAQGGVLPFIHDSLLRKKKDKTTLSQEY